MHPACVTGQREGKFCGMSEDVGNVGVKGEGVAGLVVVIKFPLSHRGETMPKKRQVSRQTPNTIVQPIHLRY
jgi:hypothetical protein